MTDFIDAFRRAVGLIVTLDPSLVEILILSLKVSLSAVAIASLFGFAIGGALAVYRFPGRGGVSAILSALMGLPPVVAGLTVYLLLSNVGPFGVLQLLYTPTAMIIAQVVLVTPIIGALTRQACQDLLEEYDEQLRSLGASSSAIVVTLLWDGRYRLITAVLAGFGRAIAEVGAVMIVGGNIDHVTRTMTTAIALGDLKRKHRTCARTWHRSPCPCLRRQRGADRGPASCQPFRLCLIPPLPSKRQTLTSPVRPSRSNSKDSITRRAANASSTGSTSRSTAVASRPSWDRTAPARACSSD